MKMRTLNTDALRCTPINGDDLYYRYTQDGKMVMLNTPIFTWARSKNYDEFVGDRLIIGPSLYDNGQSIMKTNNKGQVSYRFPWFVIFFTLALPLGLLVNLPFMPLVAFCYAIYAFCGLLKYGMAYKYDYMAEFMSLKDMFKFVYLRHKYLVKAPSQVYNFKGYSFDSNTLTMGMDPFEKVDFLAALDLKLTFVPVPREIQKNLHKKLVIDALPGSLSLTSDDDSKGHLSLVHGLIED